MPGAAARRRCSTRCSAATSRAPAPSGTLAWAVDVDNPASGEAFTLTLKEVHAARRPTAAAPSTRPCAIGFSGNYPRALDGLARLLSLDMRVIDPAWIGMKLRKLLNYAEPLGHFMAFVPGLPHGERRQQIWPSTVAYMARLVIHRYAMLGVLDEEGFPLRDDGHAAKPPTSRATARAAPIAGTRCPECGNADADPQGRLRLLHRLRLRRRSAGSPRMAVPSPRVKPRCGGVPNGGLRRHSTGPVTHAPEDARCAAS